jgi:thiosulfate/3-mercaptopyruvate sulfurtransferase
MKQPTLRKLIALTITASAIATAFPAMAAGLIVSPQEFQTLSAQSGVKILDIRSKADFDKGHIAGAIHLPWQSLNVSERDGIRNEYSDDADIERVLSAAGLNYNDTLLIYGANSLAGRAYTVLEYAGFEKIHVLNGGLGQWAGKLVTASKQPVPSKFTLSRKKENRVERQDVAQRIGSEQSVIVDGRYLSASEDGAIPSAKLIPVTDFLDEKRVNVRSREAVLAELKAQGITPDKEVISYCGSGAFASSSYLFLKDLGFTNVKFYDKSWDEWSRVGAPQEIKLENFSYSGNALTANASLGPKFLDQNAVKTLQQDKNVVVVDVRPYDDFVVGRIPGSVNVYWNDTLTANRELKSEAELRELFKAQGVTPDKHVIIFARGGLQLAQSYLTLKLLGFNKVDTFSGNWDGWVNPGYGPSKI